jgi:hypothetical protein
VLKKYARFYVIWKVRKLKLKEQMDAIAKG